MPLNLGSWLNRRSAGVLLHPTSLPGPCGIGSFGVAAYRWVDFLAQAGAKYWQMLPLGTTSYSPYQAYSSFAGTPYLIDLLALCGEGLLKEDDLKCLEKLSDTKVDFAAQNVLRYQVLNKAYETFKKNRGWNVYGDFNKFRATHASWLKPYAMFMALKDFHGGKMWSQWPSEFSRYDKAATMSPEKQAEIGVERHEFYQYIFFGQWQRLKGYAAGRGVQIIGDIPIYVLYDSADVWTQPELFQLDKNQKPTHVAGCPPDYFNADGQHWGNPLYDWPLHKKTKYQWWIKRLSHSLQLFDVLRIDHFRAFHDFWSIPASAPNARTGQWVKGPGIEFFEAVAALLPDAKLIAEDLGDLHDGVRAFLKETGLPGLQVFQFGFGGDANNLNLPHNAIHNQIAYTGTHDNDTLAGWYANAKDHEREHAFKYLNCHGPGFVEAAMRAVMGSASRLAVVPVQDLLGLGAEARMNVPGRAESNWDWRMTQAMFDQLNANHLRELLGLYGRV